MLKKMSSLGMLCLCGAVLSTSFLCAQENDVDDRVFVGARTVSIEEHVAQQDDRTKSSLNMQEDNLPDVVQVAAAEGSEESERVTQHDMFYTSHAGAFHRAYSVGIYGDPIELEDGSVWSVYSRDAYKTLNWLPSDLIVITPNRSWFSTYGYRLTNQYTGVSVEANLTLGPIYNAPCTHWIVGVDYYTNVVYLEDGTVWNMSYFSESTVRKWVVNDTVIIGINDGWLSSSNPNILINVNMLNHAAGIVAN